MRRLLLFIVFCTPATAGTFTLEQVLSAPFPSELVASHDGSKLAWSFNERGARNIWIASAPDYKGVRVTSYTEDDGQDIGQLEWTPDDRSVVYTRGGDLEFLGRPDPNPAANPAGVEQAVWIVSPGESTRKLGAGHSPAISPHGDRVAFLRAGQIWISPLTGNAPAEMLIHARSGVSASGLEWSPDGSKLAFVSDRITHSFITVYDLAGKTLTYIAGRQADRVHSHLRGGWKRTGCRTALGHSCRQHRDWRRTANLARRSWYRQRIPPDRVGAPAKLGRRRAHSFSMGKRRLVPSLFRRRRRRSSQTAHTRRI
jgi:hypothetical protein